MKSLVIMVYGKFKIKRKVSSGRKNIRIFIFTGTKLHISC